MSSNVSTLYTRLFRMEREELLKNPKEFKDMDIQKSIKMYKGYVDPFYAAYEEYEKELKRYEKSKTPEDKKKVDVLFGQLGNLYNKFAVRYAATSKWRVYSEVRKCFMKMENYYRNAKGMSAPIIADN